MGVIKLSKKVKRTPVVGMRYWADRLMSDFMPHVAYDVPVDGGTPSQSVLEMLHDRIYFAETAADPLGTDAIGIHIERHAAHLTITIGSFAT